MKTPPTHRPLAPVSGQFLPQERDAVGNDQELEQDAIDLHRALTDLVRVYQFRDRSRICCEDISVTQCYALATLVRVGNPSLQRLASEMYLDKSTTSRVVVSLVRKGYARRVPEPKDGRVVRIEPTDSGRELYDRIERRLLAHERELIADFDPEVRQAMARLMARLARAAKERLVRGNEICATRRETAIENEE